MPRSPSEKRRRSVIRAGSAWVAPYKVRISQGLEYCRICAFRGSADNPLTIDEIVPISKGGRREPSNCTILCYECNTRKADAVLGFALTPLSKERRWRPLPPEFRELSG